MNKITKKSSHCFDQIEDCVDFILNGIGRSKPLTKEEEYELWTRMQQGDTKARKELIMRNLRYVVDVAKKFQNSNVPLEDIIQAGNEGLINAVNRFDGSRGCRLISYATWYIENEMRKAVHNYKYRVPMVFDKPFDEEDTVSLKTLMENVRATNDQMPDWTLRYTDALIDFAVKIEKRQFGYGKLVTDYHDMLAKGYSTSEFANKHRLNDKMMSRFLTILSEEARRHLTSAA